MKPLFKMNQRDFDDYIPVISESPDSWQLVTISLSRKCRVPYDELIAKINDLYNGVPGIVYNLGYFRIVAFVKHGRTDNYSTLRKDLIDQLAISGLVVTVRSVNEAVLKAFQKSFLTPDQEYNDHFAVCEDRQKPVFMVADDDPMVLKIMEKILSPHGELVTVSSGDVVSDVYGQTMPDLLFLDIHMPGMHGLGNLFKIMNDHPFSSIVLLSADSTEPRILQGMEYGAAGFVGKPIQKESVEKYIEKCLTISGASD